MRVQVRVPVSDGRADGTVHVRPNAPLLDTTGGRIGTIVAAEVSEGHILADVDISEESPMAHFLTVLVPDWTPQVTV